MIHFPTPNIPVTTLPRLWQLLSSLFTHQSSGNLWCYPGQKAVFLSRGAWGISEAVKEILKFRKKTHGIVFLPDYFCNQALLPLRLLPVQLVFYPITEQLNPDLPLMDELVSRYGSPDVFILVHYFGFPAEIPQVVQFCQKNGSELLEDCAHVFASFGEVGKHSWASVFSPYKLLPVPKMGILAVSEKIKLSDSICKKVDVEIFKWTAKRLLQSFLVHCKIPLRLGKTMPFESDPVSSFEENHSINIFSLRLLKILEPELEHYKTIRRAYYKILEDQLSSISDDIARPVFSLTSKDVTPYLFPVRIDEKIIKDVYYHLNKAGILAQTWPDLPPEVKENPSQHETALKLRRSILTLPVHQSLSEGQIKYIGHNLCRAIVK